MLKRMHPSLAQRCVAEAARSPRSNPRVSYPRWYLQRWHFLPEGYLSRRSAAGYETVVRQLYNLTRESAVLKSLLKLMQAEKHDDVLELGCGPGRALQALSEGQPKTHLTGLDLSPFMLERAERRNHGAPRANLVHGDGGRAPVGITCLRRRGRDPLLWSLARTGPPCRHLRGAPRAHPGRPALCH